MKRVAIVMGMIAMGCGKSNPVTINGTILCDWVSTKASRANIAKATIGPRTTKDYTIHVGHKDTPPFKLAVHVETAPVDYVESGTSAHQLTPVMIRVTVKDNPAWELSGKCVDGPNYEMPSMGPDGGFVTPLGMIQECQINEHYLHPGILGTRFWAVGFSINVHGDGTVKAFPADDVKVE